LGVITVNETVLREGSKTYRPLCEHLGLSAQCYSKHLQRLIVDFGAECSFEKSRQRLCLHHGIAVSASSIRKLTLKHARNIGKETRAKGVHGLVKSKGASCIITEMDGSMVPLVSVKPTTGEDSRKHRQCHWHEARLCVAQEHGQTSSRYGVSFGSVQEAGYAWSNTVAKCNWSISTSLHVVGDGATWIAQQSKQCLNSDYLLDFYHACDYLAGASSVAATHPRWLEIQKQRLKNNRPDRVLQSLKPYIEEPHVPDEEAPVRKAYRYLSNRMDQLDYKTAIENNLPIGSGLIESAHRHILQARLKIAGAWWTLQNAQDIAALRVARANNEEELYWKSAA
jgi:hypothetical protein